MQREEAAAKEHPPAPGGHIREELHEGQQIVVVIRHQAQGTAQLPELWGQPAPQGVGEGAPLTSPPALLEGKRASHGGQGQEECSLAFQ